MKTIVAFSKVIALLGEQQDTKFQPRGEKEVHIEIKQKNRN